jgi:hypothetical protein
MRRKIGILCNFLPSILLSPTVTDSLNLSVVTSVELLKIKFPYWEGDKIVIDPENATVTLNYAYPYEIDLDRIKTERDLLAWALHLSEKTRMNIARICAFITKVGKIKRFQRIALRFEKTEQNFAAFITLACAFILVNPSTPLR